MQGLTGAKLLDVWERGYYHNPTQRAITLLAAACPSISHDDLLGMTIGERDRLLLDLREKIFGQVINAITICPECGEEMEIEFLTGDVREPVDTTQNIALSLVKDDYTIEFRVPSSEDLSTIDDTLDPEASRMSLLNRCIVQCSRGGEPCGVPSLPSAILDAIEEEMLRADPQADVTISLHCYACHHEWLTTFDIVSYLWTELTTLAKRTMYEIHMLASAYGWGEADILAMSSWKRERYLEMIG
jgi:hypothetical protein